MTAPALGCYVGLREPTGALVTRPAGTPLELAPSLAIWRHSPTGFEWRFGGSGLAQLALALLLDHTGDPVIAEHLHQRFKEDIVAGWNGRTWTLEPRAIDVWLALATE